MKHKLKSKFRFSQLFCYLIIAVSLVILAWPLSLMLQKSLERNGLGNYTQVLERINILRNLLNSFFVVGTVLALTVIVCSLAAFGFSKLRFRGRNVLFVIILMGIMIPASSALFPTFRLTKAMGLMGKLPSLIGPYTTSNAIFGLLMLKIFYDDLPNELMDAARIDGASSFQVFSRIMFPMSKPGLSVLLINTFNGAWNELMMAITLIPDMENSTMATIPYRYQQLVEGLTKTDNKYNLIFACLILCLIPIIIFYSFAQRLIVNGITTGAVKG